MAFEAFQFSSKEGHEAFETLIFESRTSTILQLVIICPMSNSQAYYQNPGFFTEDATRFNAVYALALQHRALISVGVVDYLAYFIPIAEDIVKPVNSPYPNGIRQLASNLPWPYGSFIRETVDQYKAWVMSMLTKFPQNGSWAVALIPNGTGNLTRGNLLESLQDTQTIPGRAVSDLPYSTVNGYERQDFTGRWVNVCAEIAEIWLQPHLP